MGGTSNNPFVPSICQTLYFVGRISSYDLDDYLISPPGFDYDNPLLGEMILCFKGMNYISGILPTKLLFS